MIVETGLAKLLLAGGSVVGSVALVTGVSGGAQSSATETSRSEIAAAVCAYAPASARTSNTTPAATPSSRKLGLSSEQLANAKVVVDTATDLGLPRRAAVIGVATTLQESWLKNSVVGDHGHAFGIFQQHPQHGWGTHAQVTNPRHAARSFYSRLVKVKDWQDKPLTVAAQAVQRSAFPDAYAKHEPRAEKIVAALSSRAAPPPTVARLALPTAELAQMKKNIEFAASLRIRRDELIDGVARNLRQQLDDPDRPVSAKQGRELINRAKQLVETLAQQLCTKLNADLGKVTEAVGDLKVGLANASARASTAVQAAMKMRGWPYSWGGGGPKGPSYGIGRGASTKGFDCSGLTEYAWARAGVKIGTVTYDQVNSGTRIPRSKVQPGDLVFYETNSSMPGPDHVGLAISSKEMVNAPFTGSVVRVDPIDRSGWAGAVRPK